MLRKNSIRIGERRGKVVVLERDPSGTSRRPKLKVRCDCGKVYVISGTTFRAVIACRECSRERIGAPRKYGGRVVSEIKLYNSWVAMRRRCNPLVDKERNKRWAGRGIRVCEEWESFESFEAWSLTHGYEPGLSLDRLDNDGDYGPGNCEWVTRSVNSKRCRAIYHFVPKAAGIRAAFYDEPCFGDF